MLHAGDVSHSDTWAAQRAGPTQERGEREHWEALGFTVEPRLLQVHRVSAAKSSVGIHPPPPLNAAPPLLLSRLIVLQRCWDVKELWQGVIY